MPPTLVAPGGSGGVGVSLKVSPPPRQTIALLSYFAALTYALFFSAMYHLLI